MNGIPWILVAILVAIVLLGVVMVVVLRKRRQPTRLDYRNYFVMGVIWLATGVVLSLLPWFLHGEVYLWFGLFFFVMGLAYTIFGLVNREKWGKQVEVPATTIRNLMIVTIVVGLLLVLGIELFALYR